MARTSRDRNSEPLERLLTIDDVAALLQVPRSTVKRWNSEGGGPKRVKMGGHVRYRPVDVQRWIGDRVVGAGERW